MAQGKGDKISHFRFLLISLYNCAPDDVHDLRPLDVSTGAIYLLKKRLKEHRQLEQSSEVADVLSILRQKYMIRGKFKQDECHPRQGALASD